MWREKMQGASFRGVPFFVDDDSTPFGRKTQVHEYPQRDTVLVEDLGRKGRVFGMTAWVAGNDAFDKRDALLTAIEEPCEGELIHPWLGAITVVATDCTVSHERTSGGYIKFDLTFVEVGDKLPSVTVSTTSALTDSIVELEELSKISFVEQITEMINEYGSIESIFDYFSEYQDLISPYINGLDDIAGLVDKIVNSPLDFAEMVYGKVMGGVGAVDKFSAIFRNAQNRLRGFQSLMKVPKTGVSGVVNTLILDANVSSGLRELAVLKPADKKEVVVQDRVLDVTASDTEGLAHKLTGNTSDLSVANSDIYLLQRILNQQLHELMLVSDAERHFALNQSRISMLNHLKSIAVSAQKLSQRTFSYQPALVLSYQLYETAARAGEITMRNKKSHPGFIGGKLEVVDE